VAVVGFDNHLLIAVQLALGHANGAGPRQAALPCRLIRRKSGNAPASERGAWASLNAGGSWIRWWFHALRAVRRCWWVSRADLDDPLSSAVLPFPPTQN
jgi:hypothetical protein